MSEVVEIPVEKIRVGEHDVRLSQEDPDLDDLAASIRRIGVIVPLHVASSGDGFELVAGHRRLSAAKRVGLATIPCIISDRSPDQQSEISFAENLFRKDLSPIELAAAVFDCLNNNIMSVEELASALHRSAHWVWQQITILDWPEDVQQAVHAGWLSVAAASNLALVTDDSYREFLLGHAHESGATARLTAAWLQAWRAMQPPSSAVQAEPIPGREPATPAVPQAPCIVCSEVFRTDELSHVPCCPHCIKVIRELRLTQRH